VSHNFSVFDVREGWIRPQGGVDVSELSGSKPAGRYLCVDPKPISVCKGEQTVVVAGIGNSREGNLLGVGDDGRSERSLSCLGEDWKKYRCQDRDDCDYHQQLDQCKPFAQFHDFF
jgi:hypothetical protein